MPALTPAPTLSRGHITFGSFNNTVKLDFATQVREEVSFTKGRVIVRGKLHTRGKQKRADHVLYYAPNLPIAVIEAKDNNHTLGDGMQQALGYAEALDTPFDVVFVADALNHCIRIIESGQVSILAGNGSPGDIDGQGLNARFNLPTGVCAHDGYVYVCDAGNNKVKRVDLLGNVETVAGTGLAGCADGNVMAAEFNNPVGVILDPVGIIYVADYGNGAIRKIDGSTVSTTAGACGSPGDAIGSTADARFAHPSDLAIDSAGDIYVMDQSNNKIKLISGGQVTLVFVLEVELRSDPALPAPTLGIVLHGADGRSITAAGSWIDGVALTRDASGVSRMRLVYPKLSLLKGHYTVSAFVMCERALDVLAAAEHVVAFEMQQDHLEQGVVSLPRRWEALV